MTCIKNAAIVMIIFIIITAVTLCSAYQIEVGWNADCNTNVTGYNVYYGNTSRNYTSEINVGNVTNAYISNLTAQVEYFAATAYISNDNETAESLYSNEAIVTNSTSLGPVTYVGVQLNYGTSLISLNSEQFQILSIVNDPGYFYSQNLVLTNNPLIGTVPDTNNQYVYVDTIITYGLGLTSLSNVEQQLTIFTNPSPNQFYSEQLIITNNPF